MSPLTRSALIAVAALVLCSCVVEIGNGRIVTQLRTVPAFEKVSVEDGIHLSLGRGDRTVALTTDENLMAFLQVFVEGDTLILRSTSNFALRPTGRLIVEVNNSVLEGLQASGGSRVNADATAASPWPLSASGGSTVSISRMETQNLNIAASGGSHVDVFGIATTITINGSGGSQINTDGVVAENVNLDASGGSALQVFASKSVTGNASGGSRVTVSGNPVVRSIDSSDDSKVTFANE